MNYNKKKHSSDDVVKHIIYQVNGADIGSRVFDRSSFEQCWINSCIQGFS